MEYPSAQQSIRVLQEDNVRLLKLVQRYSCFTKLFFELCNDIQKEEFFEMEKDYQIILNEIQCSTSESVHNKKSSLPLSFDSDVMQHQIHNYTISNSNINSIGLTGGNNVMENLPLFDELDVSGQFAMNGYLARAINQNNMHELFSRPIINSPTRQISIDNESLILNQLNIPNQIGHMNTFQVESNDFSRTSEENNLIQILRTNQALSQQQQKLYFPLAEASQQQSPESCVPGIVKFTSNPFLNYTDVNTQQQDPLTIQHPATVSTSTATLQHHQTDQMIFGDPQSQQYDLNSDSNMSMLMRLSSATSSSSSLLPSMNSRMFVDQSQLQQAVQLQEQEQQQQQQQQQQLLTTIEQASQQHQQEQLLQQQQQQQEQQQLLQEQVSQQQLLQQEASRQQLLQQESSRQHQQLLQEQQLRQEQQQQLLRQEQLERQRQVPQSPHPVSNNSTMNSAVPNGQLMESQIHGSRKEGLSDSIRLYQHANEETLDLSQNMTDGIHLHRRKLKLTSNYHHSHLLNDSNNNNNNNPHVSNNSNNNNNNSSHVNNNNSNSSHVNNGHNPCVNSSHVSNNNNSVTQNNNNASISNNGLEKEALQVPQSAHQASLQSQLESLSQTSLLSHSPLHSQTQSQSLSKSQIASQTLSLSIPQSRTQSLSQGQSQTLSNSQIQAQSQSQSQHSTQPSSNTPLDARIHSIANQNNLVLKTDSPPAAIIVDLSKNDAGFYDDCSMFSKENDKFPCTLGDCQEFFTDQMALSLHMKRKHGILRPFKCRFEGCKAEFKELHKLKVHGVVHTKDKPFKCDFPGCDARFSQSGHVSRHKKNHLQETNYLCTWEGCNKQFKQKHNLKIHLINHLGGEKPWACDVKGCNRAFVEKWKLVKHKKTHLRGVNANANGQRDS